jgi:outer membrane receptor protein involved in Fe transport
MTFADFEADFDLHRSTNSGERTDVDFEEAMLFADYGLGEHTITAIAGHSEYDYYLGGDTDTSPAAVIAFSVPEDFEQDSLELRWTSPQGERFEWIAGAYWQQSDLRYQTDVAIHLLTGLINSNPAFAALQPYTPIGPSGVLFQDEETRSLFGALTWSFTDRLRATLGLRWTEVEKNARQMAGPAGPMGFYGDGPALPADVAALGAALTGAVPHDNRISRKDDDLIPSLNVQYDLGNSVMLYGSFSSGFKAGGFDAFELSGDVDRLSFGPETVDAYEAGFKANWRDAGVSLNVAVFRNEYEDLQQSVAQTGASGITFFSVSNVGGLVAQGIEADLIWALDENWRINFSGALLDAEYEDYDQAGCTATQQLTTTAGQTCTQDLSGEPPPFAPDYSGSVGIEYSRPFANSLEISASLTMSFTDDYDVISDNDPNLKQDAYQKLDARVGVGAADGSWEIAVLGKNLTDEWTSPFGQDAPTSPGSYWRLLDRPRTIALQGRYNW